MNYLRFTQYFYLVFAGFFIYDGIDKMRSGENPWISFGLAAVAIFMFFFRRKFGRRFAERNKTP